MSNEFVAREGIVIKNINSGVTETDILVRGADGLIKYRSDISLVGTSGTDGASGSSGTDGTSGSSGTDGTSGRAQR